MEWIIYLIGIVDNLSTAFTLVGPIGGLIVLFLFIFSHLELEENEGKAVRNALKKISYVVVPAIVLAMLTPSSKVIAAMYLIPTVVESENVQNISDKGMKLLDSKLDGWIKEMAEEGKEK